MTNSIKTIVKVIVDTILSQHVTDKKLNDDKKVLH